MLSILVTKQDTRAHFREGATIVRIDLPPALMLGGPISRQDSEAWLLVEKNLCFVYEADTLDRVDFGST